jgi:hypothetical protein
MAVKNSKNAIWALAAAGGMWAWQNRDKIKGFIDQQRSTMQTNTNQAYNQPRIHDYSEPAIGETRRMSTDEYNASGEFSNETKTKYDPSI